MDKVERHRNANFRDGAAQVEPVFDQTVRRSDLGRLDGADQVEPSVSENRLGVDLEQPPPSNLACLLVKSNLVVSLNLKRRHLDEGQRAVEQGRIDSLVPRDTLKPTPPPLRASREGRQYGGCTLSRRVLLENIRACHYTLLIALVQRLGLWPFPRHVWVTGCGRCQRDFFA